MADTSQAPTRPLAHIAAVDAVQALTVCVDALIAVEYLLDPPMGLSVSTTIEREKLSALMSVLNTRLFLDVQAAEACVVEALHHCDKES